MDERIEVDRAEWSRRELALKRINAIRHSILGRHRVIWSEHVYPLVAALNDAGFEGMNYPERIPTEVEFEKGQYWCPWCGAAEWPEEKQNGCVRWACGSRELAEEEWEEAETQALQSEGCKGIIQLHREVFELKFNQIPQTQAGLDSSRQINLTAVVLRGDVARTAHCREFSICAQEIGGKGPLRYQFLGMVAAHIYASLDHSQKPFDENKRDPWEPIEKFWREKDAVNWIEETIKIKDSGALVGAWHINIRACFE